MAGSIGQQQHMQGPAPLPEAPEPALDAAAIAAQQAAAPDPNGDLALLDPGQRAAEMAAQRQAATQQAAVHQHDVLAQVRRGAVSGAQRAVDARQAGATGAAGAGGSVAAPAGGAAGGAAARATAGATQATAEQRLASWQPGVYPDGGGLDGVRAGTATLSINQGGEGVRALQERLNALGAQPPLDADGKLGPKTFAALRERQAAMGVEPSGVLDKATLEALDRAQPSAPGAVQGGAGTPGAGGAGGPGGPGASGGAGGTPGVVAPSGGGGVSAGGAVPFTPNAQALDAARRSAVARDLDARTARHADTYRAAAERTGVPASLIAAIHFNESHQSVSTGPESGFGLDPRAVSDGTGNAILAKYGMGPWQRGGGTEQATLQSAVIAADLLKSNAKHLGIELGPHMSAKDLAVAITAYGTGAGSKSTKRAQESGTSFLFDPSDPQPHVRHPGGSSVGADGRVVQVGPGVKQGLLRWDVLVPLMNERVGGLGTPGAPAPGSPAPGGGAAPGGGTSPGGATPSPSRPGAGTPAPSGPAPRPSSAPPPSMPAPTGPTGPGGPSGPGGATGPAPTPPSGGASPLAALPPRPADAETGSQFAQRIMNLRGPAREQAILDEVLKGNIPDALRQMRPVTTSFTGPDGRQHTATVHVMPDYLAVGSDGDSIRVPMSAETAQRIADRLGCSLPTSKIVDDVYKSADVRLVASPRDDWKYSDGRMMSTASYQAHDRTIDGQLQGRGGLVAGHKKDVVISNAQVQNPSKLAFYGWFDAQGKPIQGSPGRASLAHEPSYADYSHGVRMVSGTITIDGRTMTLAEALRDPVYSRAVSNEGPMASPRVPGVR